MQTCINEIATKTETKISLLILTTFQISINMPTGTFLKICQKRFFSPENERKWFFHNIGLKHFTNTNGSRCRFRANVRAKSNDVNSIHLKSYFFKVKSHSRERISKFPNWSRKWNIETTINNYRPHYSFEWGLVQMFICLMAMKTIIFASKNILKVCELWFTQVPRQHSCQSVKHFGSNFLAQFCVLYP